MSQEEVKTVTNGDNNKEKPKIVINTKLFWSRLRHFYDVWKQGGKLWGATGADVNIVDAVVLCYGPDDDENEYSRSLAIQLALFGYEITETILVFTSDVLYIVTGPKKGKILEPLGERDGDNGNLRLKLLVTGKGADKNDKIQQHYATLIKQVKASRKGKRIGYVEKAPKKGALVTGFISALTKAGLELIDIASGLANVMSVKDRDALACIKKAAQFSSQVMRKFLIPELETVIDEEKSVVHSEFADRVDDVIRDPAKVKSDLRATDVDSCYSPIIMSGGKYDLKPSAASNQDQLDYGTIICQLGARYKNYCSNIGRTFFINPTEDQHATYLLLIEVYQAALSAMKPKNKLSQVYLAAEKVIKAKKPELMEKFTQNCGFGLGLEFRESSLVLNATNPRLLAPGMTFNLVMGFDRLTCPDKDDPAKTRHYAVLLSDTVMITEDEAETLTACPRKYAEIAYFTGGEEKAEEAIPVEESKEPASRGVTRDRLRTSALNDEEETEKKRRQHQEELARRKNEEAMRKFAADQADRMFSAAPSLKDGKIKSYESPAHFPPEAKENRIYVDHKAESLLLPINDQLVPFHIATVKNVHKTEEGQYTMLRINFATPDQPLAKNSGDLPDSASTYKYLREIVYRTIGGSLDKVFFDIKELRKRVQDRSKEYEAKRNIVAQQELRIDKSPNPPRLKDIFVKPQISKKKQTSGILTAHLNGLRYITLDKQKIDIIYDNIASAFYQPAEQTHAVLLHFELKNPILLDNTKTKKTNFVQFFVEVVESSEDLASTNRYRDEDGLQEEQEERLRRKKWNERFLDFVKQVEDTAQKKGQVELEFDIPYRELAFSGVPNKQVVMIMPTVKSLIALDDSPPLVIPLSEIEIANCERVQFGLRAFDLVFVWKDFSKPPVVITGIPTHDLAKVKNWLDSCDILTFESAQNLNWKNIMKSVNEDVKGFYSDGGWSFLNDNVGGEEGGEGGEGDEDGGGAQEPDESDFAPSEDESDSEEYETPSSEGSGEDEDESDASDVSEEDEGESWEELEEKAKRSDRNKGDEDSDDDRPVKKAKTQPVKRR